MGADSFPSPRTPAIISLAIIASVFAGGGIWASEAPLASAVIAPGTLVVEGHRQVVQHQDGGTIKRLMVGDGQRVQAGQVLIVLDLSVIRAELGAL